ncbi:MAG: ATP synthase F0 subunit B [Candidatus Levybacteria bacterium RIFCSPLOWO2_02_FULL_36_8b]|nr:MAG: ATP synthase F0 subunit B [Candidatus Levybacteria bacterium RIFCSPLOWO2_02_FULL_36_8b]
MELIKNFGLDPVFLGAQIVNFLIILYLLRRFLYKPVFQMLKKRASEIKEGLEKTEEARKLLENTLEQEKNILKKAQTHATKIMEDAKNEALEIQKKSEEAAKKHAEKIINETREQIEREAKETEDRIIANVSKISVSFLEKALSGLFTEKEQKELMTRAVKKLK